MEGFLIDKSDFNEFNQNTRTFLNGFPCIFQINYCPWATNSINSFALPSILAGFVDLSVTNYHTLAHFYRINISFHLYVSVCMSIWITLLNVKKVFVPVQSTYFWRACQKNDLLTKFVKCPWKSFCTFSPKELNRILYWNTVFSLYKGKQAEWTAPKLYLNQRFSGKLYNSLTGILCQNDEWFRFPKRTINVTFSDTIAMCNFCDSISFHEMDWFVHRTSVCRVKVGCSFAWSGWNRDTNSIKVIWNWFLVETAAHNSSGF